MSTIQDNDENKENQSTGDLGSQGDIGQDSTGDAAQQPLSTSSSSTMQTGQTPQASSQQQSQAGSASGQRYRNLKKLITKNQQSNIAGKIGENLSKDASKLSSGVGKAQKLFDDKTAAEQARQKSGEDLMKSGFEDVRSYFNQPNPTTEQRQDAEHTSQIKVGVVQPPSTDQEVTNKRVVQPIDYSNISDSGKNIQSILNNQDVNVKSGQAQGLKQGLDTLATKAGQAASESGRLGLLKDTFGRERQYSGGAKNLDAMLLQSNRDQLKQLDQTRRNVGKDVTQQYGQLTGQEEAAQKMYADRAKELQEGIKSGIEGQLGSETARVRKLVNEANNPDAQNAFRNRVASGKLTSEDLQRLGLTAGQQIYGTNLNDNKYYTDAEVANAANIMDADAQAKYQALMGLGGIEDSSQYLSNLDPSQAGTYKGYGQDIEALKNDIATRKGEYDNMVKQKNQLITQNKTNDSSYNSLKNNLDKLRSNGQISREQYAEQFFKLTGEMLANRDRINNQINQTDINMKPYQSQV